MKDNIYQFSALLNTGYEIPLSHFKGKVLLVVNTASKCKFTSQYESLEKIYKMFGNKIEILAFPCNQFAKQEPGDDQQIQEFCRTNYQTSFCVFQKTKVNGKDAHPIFSYLQNSLPGVLGSKKIKWNFTKFLIDKEGKPIKRFAPYINPEQLTKDIEVLIKQRK